MKRIALIALVFVIVGCSSRTLEVKTATVKGKANTSENEFGMVATGANTRMIMANLGNGRVCAEPPPETQVTINTTFRALLESSKNISGDDSKSNEARIEAYRAYSQAVTQLYKRSHSNQVYRDASYYLCQAYMNGALENRDILFLLGAFSALETNDSKLQKLYRQLSTDLKNQNISIGGAYLATQLVLTKMAFNSLEHEIPKFYEFTTAKDQGRAEAQLQFQTMLNSTKEELNSSIQSTAGATQREVNEVEAIVNKNAASLVVLKADVKKIPIE